jgi:hypothetical protein
MHEWFPLTTIEHLEMIFNSMSKPVPTAVINLIPGQPKISNIVSDLIVHNVSSKFVDTKLYVIPAADQISSNVNEHSETSETLDLPDVAELNTVFVDNDYYEPTDSEVINTTKFDQLSVPAPSDLLHLTKEPFGHLGLCMSPLESSLDFREHHSAVLVKAGHKSRKLRRTNPTLPTLTQEVSEFKLERKAAREKQIKITKRRKILECAQHLNAVIITESSVQQIKTTYSQQPLISEVTESCPNAGISPAPSLQVVQSVPAKKGVPIRTVHGPQNGPTAHTSLPYRTANEVNTTDTVQSVDQLKLDQRSTHTSRQARNQTLTM